MCGSIIITSIGPVDKIQLVYDSFFNEVFELKKDQLDSDNNKIVVFNQTNKITIVKNKNNLNNKSEIHC